MGHLEDPPPRHGRIGGVGMAWPARRAQALKIIKDYLSERGRTPTGGELGDALGLTADRGSQIIRRLNAEGEDLTPCGSLARSEHFQQMMKATLSAITELEASLGRPPTPEEVVEASGFSRQQVISAVSHFRLTGVLPRTWRFSMAPPDGRASRYGKVRDYVLANLAEDGTAPSVAETAAAVGMGRRGVQEHLATLVAEGRVPVQPLSEGVTDEGIARREMFADFVKGFNRRHGYSPSTRECARATGWEYGVVRYYIDMCLIGGYLNSGDVAWRRRMLEEGETESVT